ncbi:hypothetical protein HELRODRAFT_165788 [Helobdella robusta]|uniref:Uncharacterized protein n=1 Tax=Helobdella robusta TaxID=6412 RepID=T1EXA3_HELRO|nr:hypothetical protein HELRODRAFT_165788 [Helobdella robusta]ESN91721.1 hypothetical protein HELRODRAFT_165788 [Helobdella robusta]
MPDITSFLYKGREPINFTDISTDSEEITLNDEINVVVNILNEKISLFDQCLQEYGDMHRCDSISECCKQFGMKYFGETSNCSPKNLSSNDPMNEDEKESYSHILSNHDSHFKNERSSHNKLCTDLLGKSNSLNVTHDKFYGIETTLDQMDVGLRNDSVKDNHLVNVYSKDLISSVGTSNQLINNSDDDANHSNSNVFQPVTSASLVDSSIVKSLSDDNSAVFDVPYNEEMIQASDNPISDGRSKNIIDNRLSHQGCQIDKCDHNYFSSAELTMTVGNDADPHHCMLHNSVEPEKKNHVCDDVYKYAHDKHSDGNSIELFNVACHEVCNPNMINDYNVDNSEKILKNSYIFHRGDSVNCSYVIGDKTNGVTNENVILNKAINDNGVCHNAGKGVETLDNSFAKDEMKSSVANNCVTDDLRKCNDESEQSISKMISTVTSNDGWLSAIRFPRDNNLTKTQVGRTNKVICNKTSEGMMSQRNSSNANFSNVSECDSIIENNVNITSKNMCNNKNFEKTKNADESISIVSCHIVNKKIKLSPDTAHNQNVLRSLQPECPNEKKLQMSYSDKIKSLLNQCDDGVNGNYQKENLFVENIMYQPASDNDITPNRHAPQKANKSFPDESIKQKPKMAPNYKIVKQQEIKFRSIEQLILLKVIEPGANVLSIQREKVNHLASILPDGLILEDKSGRVHNSLISWYRFITNSKQSKIAMNQLMEVKYDGKPLALRLKEANYRRSEITNIVHNDASERCKMGIKENPSLLVNKRNKKTDQWEVKPKINFQMIRLVLNEHLFPYNPREWNDVQADSDDAQDIIALLRPGLPRTIMLGCIVMCHYFHIDAFLRQRQVVNY